MYIQEVQDVLEARLKACRDAYMGIPELKLLRDNLKFETHAERVAADRLPGTNTLRGEVWVHGQHYQHDVDLNVEVPHVDMVHVPAHTALVRDDAFVAPEDREMTVNSVQGVEEPREEGSFGDHHEGG